MTEISHIQPAPVPLSQGPAAPAGVPAEGGPGDIRPDSVAFSSPLAQGSPAGIPTPLCDPGHKPRPHHPIKPIQSIGETPSVDLLPVPDVRQCTNYSCGPSALQAVLMYYGEEWIETELMQMCGTTPEGTGPKNIARVAREIGFNAEIKEQMTLEDLETLCRQKIPVIISAQCWREGESQNKPWKDIWDDGHYMVVIGLDEKNVYFEDPSMLGSKGFIPRDEFLERWHDMDEKKYEHMGIIISGKSPSPPPAYMPVFSEPPQTEFPF